MFVGVYANAVYVFLTFRLSRIFGGALDAVIAWHGDEDDAWHECKKIMILKTNTCILILHKLAILDGVEFTSFVCLGAAAVGCVIAVW